MYNPFFTIITRTFCRPSKLAIGIQSVKRQTCQDVEQIFLLDRSGNHPEGNVLWANRQFARYTNRIDGIYVIPMDDEGRLVDKDYLEKIKNCAIENDFPDVILVRTYTLKNIVSGEYHHLPPDDIWDLDWDNGERPIRWSGNGGNCIARYDVFMAMCENFGHAPGGDWYFATSLVESGCTFVKCNTVGGSSMSRGRGKDFEECTENWMIPFARKNGIKNLGNDDWRLQLWQKRK